MVSPAPSVTSLATSRMSRARRVVRVVLRHVQRGHVAAALVSLGALACTHPISGNEVAAAQREPLAMRRAAEQAQATLDGFLTNASRLPAGSTSHAVMIEVREGSRREYFWVREFSWSDGSFTGKIEREPRVVSSVKSGQVHRFSRNDIVDWTYVDETTGRTFGNFTACPRPSNETPARGDGLERRADPHCP